MEIILKKNVDNLGEVNDIVNVKNGYGRNYLIPQGYAVIANETNRKVHAENMRQQQHKAEAIYKEAKASADAINKASISVGAKVAKDGEKIFGSVTSIQLVDAIKKQTGIVIDRKKVSIQGDIKTIGGYTASVELHRELKVDVKFNVVAE
tara:strand:+ start:301 stop:750 length:450 start_codon:yes stop_codon:yes gene_type:complete